MCSWNACPDSPANRRKVTVIKKGKACIVNSENVTVSTVRCRIDVSPTDVSRPKILGCCAPWTKRPLDIVPLTDVSRPWTAPSMELALSAATVASVGLRHLRDQWGVWPASPTPLTRFIRLAPLRRMHDRPTHTHATVGSRESLCSIKSEFRDGMVRSGEK